MLMLLEILLAWTVANVVPHLVIIALAGKPYFALTPVPGLLSELSIMSLNLALPVVLLILFHKKGGSSPPERLREGLSWR